MMAKRIPKKSALTPYPKSNLFLLCESNPILAPWIKSGLSAFSNNERKKIQVAIPSLLKGSINLDEAAKAQYPHDNRWDYLLEYDKEAFFIEIHPAHTSEIDCMIKKVQFVKSWLTSIAPDILKLPGTEKFYWVSSGTTDLRVLPNSPQAKKLALNKILPVGKIWDYNKLTK